MTKSRGLYRATNIIPSQHVSVMDLPMQNLPVLQEQWEEESEFLPVSLEQLMEELLFSTETSRLRMKIHG